MPVTTNDGSIEHTAGDLEVLRPDGQAVRLGITGAPGAGKSTTIDALGSALTAQGHMVAVRAGFDYDKALRSGARIRVATKYVDTAREHFATKGMHVDLIKLYGSMELAPLVGLADAIVDVVSTGSTLKANGLLAVEEVGRVSARLVVNQAALKLKRAPVQALLDAFESAVNAAVSASTGRAA